MKFCSALNFRKIFVLETHFFFKLIHFADFAEIAFFLVLSKIKDIKFAIAKKKITKTL